MEAMEQRGPLAESQRGDEMRTPDEVAAMARLRALGWGTKRSAYSLPSAVRRSHVSGPPFTARRST